MLLYQILAFAIRGKNVKMAYKKLKYQLPLGMKNLNYLMDHVLCQIFKIILRVSSKNMKH